MAVSNPEQINLAPHYANIISALQQRAQIERDKPPSALAQATKSFTDNALNAFQKSFEQSLKQKIEEKNKIRITEDDAKAYSQELGIPYDKIKPAIGIPMSPEERQQFINQVAEFTRENEGMRLIHESVGKDGGLTRAQYAAFLAGGKDAQKAFAQQMFQKAASGSPKFENVEYNGVSYPVESQMLAAAQRSAQATGRPLTDFINFSVLNPTGYKATVTSDPRDKEKAVVSGSGSAYRKVTGPEPPEKVIIGDDVKLIVNSPEMLSPYERDQIAVQGDKISTAPIVKDAIKTLGSMRTVQNLMLENIAATTESLKSQTARAIATEVGRLTDQDVGRASGSQALARVWARWQEQITTGRMADKDRAEFLEAINTIASATLENTGAQTDAVVSRQLERFNTKERQFDRGFLRKQMGIDFEEFRPTPVFNSIEDANKGAKKYKFNPGDKVIILTGPNSYKEAIWEPEEK